MVFWRRDDKRKKELENIKNRIEGKEQELGGGAKPLPPPPPPEKMEEPKEPKVPEVSHVPMPAPIVEERKKETAGAPLFIKIEKYEEVLKMLEELKNNLKILTRLLSFHQEIEELRGDVFTRIKNTTSSITNILISLDEIFVKPERPGVTEREEGREEKSLEEEILDLGEELRHLKRELSKIE